MKYRPLLYVAGPYTRPDPVENTHRAIKTATAIYDHTDWMPVLPHLTMLWHVVVPRPLEFWYAFDMNMLNGCQGFVRLPGPSSGADAEEQVAIELGLEIVEYYGLPFEVIAEWGIEHEKTEVR